MFLHSVFTIHFHFAEIVVRVSRIPSRKRRIGSVVVVDDVSTMLNTCNVDRIWYRGSGVVRFLKAQYTIRSAGRIENVNGESKQSGGVSMTLV